MKPPAFSIGENAIGPGHPVYIVAEMSANHNQDFKQALAIIAAAKQAGADAIKIQTYTASTITLNARNEYFNVTGTIWEGKNLYDLYQEAHTPWDWQPKLKAYADEIDIELFSSPFDETAVDFLEDMAVAAYKVASFELVDIPLLKKIAATGKSVIVSTGMATLAEIEEAVAVLRATGNDQVALLKCTSAYPAPAEEMNLQTIPHLANTFQLPVGLSDHTLGDEVAIAAVALGACVIEKHLTLSRQTPGPDSSFSMEPHEFAAMVDRIRCVEKALGKVTYEMTAKQKECLKYRRSLFIAADMNPGDVFSPRNVRSVRPADGLHTRFLPDILGKKVTRAVQKGTPLTWDIIA